MTARPPAGDARTATPATTSALRPEVVQAYRADPRGFGRERAADGPPTSPRWWPVIAGAALVVVLLAAGFLIRVPVHLSAVVQPAPVGATEVTVLVASGDAPDAGSTVQLEFADPGATGGPATVVSAGPAAGGGSATLVTLAPGPDAVLPTADVATPVTLVLPDRSLLVDLVGR